MSPQLLQEIGLNPSQARVYLALIEKGALTPPQVADAAEENRTNAYMVLEQLEKLGLAEKVPEAKKLTYQATNPSRLRQLHIEKSQHLNKVGKNINALLPALVNQYRLSHDQTGVVQMEGVESFGRIYDDLISHGEIPLIIPSMHDRDDQEIAKIIDQQIARQQKAGIQSNVLLSNDSSLKGSEHTLAEQGINISVSIQARVPAQIMIYGDNVAMTTFRSGISSTVITNPEIAETLRSLLMQLWTGELPVPVTVTP
jgi:sugar-specific transcriptional regulator TrmB